MYCVVHSRSKFSRQSCASSPTYNLYLCSYSQTFCSTNMTHHTLFSITYITVWMLCLLYNNIIINVTTYITQLQLFTMTFLPATQPLPSYLAGKTVHRWCQFCVDLQCPSSLFLPSSNHKIYHPRIFRVVTRCVQIGKLLGVETSLCSSCLLEVRM